MPISHTTLHPFEKKEAVLKWKVWEEIKKGEKAKEHLLFPKTLLPAYTFASPPPAMLSSRITAL